MTQPSDEMRDAYSDVFARLEDASAEARAHLFYLFESRWCWSCGEVYDHCDCASEDISTEEESVDFHQAVASLPLFSIVRPRPDASSWKWRSENPQPETMPLRIGDLAIFLGMIAGDPQRCVVATLQGRPLWPLNPDEFEPVPIDEITVLADSAASYWQSQVPGVELTYPRNTVLRLKEGEGRPDWTQAKNDSHLLYLGESPERPGEFDASTWFGQVLRRSDLHRFEPVPFSER